MKAIEAFKLNIERARGLLELYRQLGAAGNGPDDIEDLLRSAYVLAVGSMDAFVHDRVGEKLVRYIRNALQSDEDTLKPIERKLEKVPIRDFLYWMTLARPFVKVRKIIEDDIGQQSFQHPGNIDKAFALIGKTKAIDMVADAINMPKRELRSALARAADRRNKIVHEGDLEKSRAKRHKKRQISIQEVEELLDLIGKVGEELNKL